MPKLQTLQLTYMELIRLSLSTRSCDLQSWAWEITKQGTKLLCCPQLNLALQILLLLYVSGEALKLYRNIARQYAYLYQRIQQVSGLKNLFLSQAFTQ